MPLPATVTSAWPAAADSALTGYLSSVRRAEISVPGASGSANGRTNTGMRPARDRDQRARVQHLGAVVGELRRLAQVELRDDARVGHHPRIRGQQAGDVLPQRHRRARPAPGRAASPSDRSRRARAWPPRAPSVTPPLSSSMRALPMKPGTTGTLPAAISGCSCLRAAAIGRVEVGRRAAERSLGEHDLRSRRRTPPPIPTAASAAAKICGRQPLAAADHEVARPRGQLLDRGEARQQRGELVHGALDLGGEPRPHPSRRSRRGESCGSGRAARRRRGRSRRLLARDGARREPEQDVGDARRAPTPRRPALRPALTIATACR